MDVGFTGRIARSAARRPWLTIAVWVVAVAASIAASGSLGSALTQDDHNLRTMESDKAAAIDEQLRPAADASVTETIVVRSDARIASDAAFRSAVAEVSDAARTVDGVTDVETSAEATSASGHAQLITVTIAAGHPDSTGDDLLAAVRATHADGFTFLNYGPLTGEAMFNGLAEDTLARGEMIGIGIAIVILIVVFGALVAAGIPLVIALVSIAAAVGATALIGTAFDLSFFIVNMITMMGLALGVDYTLVMVQRFREELARGRSTMDAVAVAGGTANRAVFFSGLTVLVSLTGMLIVPSTIMRSLGAGAMLAAVMAVASALTLLPAVLRLLGPRVNKGRIPWRTADAEPRTWKAIARRVTSRPVVGATAGLAILVAIAAPALGMRLTFPGLDALPADNEFRMAADTLITDFGYGGASTLVVVEGATAQEVDSLAAAIDDSPAYAQTTVDWRGDTAFIDTRDVYDAADPRAEVALKDLRTTIVPAHVTGTAFVGGDQASTVDFTRIITDSAPWVLLTVLGASFVLLLVAFRSIVVPLTAIVLNVLSAAAAFGLLVVVFQWGWGADLLGFAQVDGIAPWIPLFLFAVLFGLSMDYHVFLLTRIKERHDAGEGTRDAVVHGLSRTGSLITGAALIMVAVFSGFALGDMAEFQMMGFGLAAAVLLDATVVRTLLVPSLMTMLGRTNWYLPRWLEWLPQMRIEVEPERELEPAPVPAVR